MTRAAREPVPHVIPGEDRSLGGSSLYVDLVPRTCWGTAARATLSSQSEWVRIRSMVCERAGQACEVCGNTRADLEEAGYAARLHTHERYRYFSPERGKHFPCTDDVQRLARLICQCIACDEVTHFGRTSTLGHRYTQRATEQALRVNGWTTQEFRDHVEEAMSLWEERNRHTWKLDVTVLRNAGARFPFDAVGGVIAGAWGGGPRKVVWEHVIGEVCD